MTVEPKVERVSRSRTDRPPISADTALLEMSRLLGRKWHPIVLNQLVGDGKGFSELNEEITEISNKMLSEALRDLEEEYELVEREIVNEQPLRVEYSLTERGETLKPVLDRMADWGREYLNA